MCCINYGNYYGPGWSGGKKSKKVPISEYIENIKNNPPIDELDRIAMHHDIGLELSRIRGYPLTSTEVNYKCGSLFLKL